MSTSHVLSSTVSHPEGWRYKSCFFQLSRETLGAKLTMMLLLLDVCNGDSMVPFLDAAARGDHVHKGPCPAPSMCSETMCTPSLSPLMGEGTAH